LAVDRGDVEIDVIAAAIEEAVLAMGILVSADDLTKIVDAVGLGVAGARGIVEPGIRDTVKEEAVEIVRPDDLAQVVDAVGNGVGGGRGIEERGINPDFGVEDEADWAIATPDTRVNRADRHRKRISRHSPSQCCKPRSVLGGNAEIFCEAPGDRQGVKGEKGISWSGARGAARMTAGSSLPRRPR
jgi:hypothetical protein